MKNFFFIRTLPNRLEGETIRWSCKEHTENSGKVHNVREAQVLATE